MERHPESLVLVEEVDPLIDFRFFIIGIVAVFLALGVGIVIGSGFVGEPVKNAIKNQIDEALDRNEALEADILDLEERLDQNDRMLDALEPVALEGKLESEQIVLVQVEGTDGGLQEGIVSAVESAGGSVTGELRLNNKLALVDEGAREDLARALDSPLTQADQLRDLFAQELGDRLAAAANFGIETPQRRGNQRLRSFELLERLADGGFLSVGGDGPTVPPDARFVVAVGSAEEPAWRVSGTVEELATSFAAQEAPIVVAETSDGSWGVVDGIREGEAADSALSTVDNAETLAGRIAVALAIDETPSSNGHWGIGEDAAAPLPTPSD